MVNVRVEGCVEPGTRVAELAGRVGSPWAQHSAGEAGLPRLVCCLQGREPWLCREVSVSLGGFACPHPRCTVFHAGSIFMSDPRDSPGWKGCD